MVESDECLHRRVDASDVPRGQEIEEQAGASLQCRGTLALGPSQATRRPRDRLGDRLEPLIDDSVEQPDGVGLAPERLAVELEGQRSGIEPQ